MTNSWHFRGLDSRSGKLQIFKDCKVCLRTSMLYRSYRRIYHAHTEHFAWQVSGLLFFFFKTLQCAWRTFRVSLHHSGAAWVSDIKHVNYQAARRALRTGKWLLLVVSVTQHPQVIWLTEDCFVSHVFFRVVELSVDVTRSAPWWKCRHLGLRWWARPGQSS